MAEGGLVQLLLSGAQDAVLVGNPEITYFRIAFRRYTNFAIESVELTASGNTDFGQEVEVPVKRYGDLIHQCWIQYKVPRVRSTCGYVYKWSRDFAYAVIRAISFEIGGQTIVRYPREWLHIHKETAVSERRTYAYDLLGTVTAPTHDVDEDDDALWAFAPIPFFFSKHAGLALPLLALQYHDVKIRIEFDELRNVLAHYTTRGDFVAQGLAPDDRLEDPFRASVWLDYVFLEPEERMRYATREHEYLIEQVQHTGPVPWVHAQWTAPLTFYHPVRSLYWVFTDAVHADARAEPFTYERALRSAKLEFNGMDRIAERPGAYFWFVQPAQNKARVSSMPVYAYHFGLLVDDPQPSGACNFSRIDRAALVLKTKPPPPDERGRLWVFAVNYNVLRISSGMGSVVYSS